MEGNETTQKVVEALTDVAPEGIQQQVRAFFSSALGQLTQIALSILAVILVMLLVRHIAASCLRRVEKRMKKQGNPSLALVGFLGHILMGLIYIGGVVSVIGVLSSTIDVVGDILNKLLAAGGIITVVAGLASQEALGSMVSGMMILAFKPFEIGNVVRYMDSDISGVVEEITVHHTTIRTWENKRVIIPNSKMNSAIIENADYGDSRVCVFLEFGITYESDIKQAKEILANQIRQHPFFLDYRTADEKADGAPPVLVRVVDLADSAVVLRAWLWANDSGTAAAMKSDLLESVKSEYESVGIDMAYPHLVVVDKAKSLENL